MRPIQFIRQSVFNATQAEFALIARVTQATVSRWESDESSSEPGRDDLGVIRAAAMDRGLAWNDAWFFDPPACHPKTQANSAENAA